MDAKEVIDRINRLYGAHAGRRALHAKGDFFEGGFTATQWASRRCSAEPFDGSTHPVLVRWSNASGSPHTPDGAMDVRGMAVSIRAPAGAVDLVGQTSPRFPVHTVEDFVAMTTAAVKKARLPAFLATHPSALPALVAGLRANSTGVPASYASVRYFPIHAYKWIGPDGAESWVRYRLSPESSTRPVGVFAGRNRLRDELRARVAAGPVRYALEVQVARGGDDPHDPMSVWRSAWHKAGDIDVTEHVADPEADGGVVVFDPTRVVPGIELSDDPILRFRALAYDESARRRMRSGPPED